MVIIPELKTIVLQPPRTGSTSLRNALLSRYPFASNPFRHMERVGIPKVVADFAVVGVVREPMARLWSLYKYMRWHPGKTEKVGPLERAWIRRVRKDADRPFEEWLLNSVDPFADMHDDGTCTSVYHSTANPSPATQKSQFDFLRPDMGDIEIIKLEDGTLEDRFDVSMKKINQSAKVRSITPKVTDNIAEFMYKYHSWDLELYE